MTKSKGNKPINKKTATKSIGKKVEPRLHRKNARYNNNID